MSVLIKGMDMPKCCKSCNFRRFTSRHVMYCEITGREMTVGKDRHASCLLVEVPTPHGDLIDRDSFIEKLEYSTIDRAYYVIDIIRIMEKVLQAEPEILKAEKK